jgi:hypothetical protein
MEERYSDTARVNRTVVFGARNVSLTNFVTRRDEGERDCGERRGWSGNVKVLNCP